MVGRIGLDERELQLFLEPRDSAGSGARSASSGSSRVAWRSSCAATPLLREPVRALELLQAPADVGRLPVVVVDGRVGHALLRLGVRALELVDQLFDSGRT